MRSEEMVDAARDMVESLGGMDGGWAGRRLFDDARHHDLPAGGLRGIGECGLLGNAVTRNIFTDGIDDGSGLVGGRNTRKVDLGEFFHVFDDLFQLGFEQLLLFGGEFQTSQCGDVVNVNLVGGHGLLIVGHGTRSMKIGDAIAAAL